MNHGLPSEHERPQLENKPNTPQILSCGVKPTTSHNYIIRKVIIKKSKKWHPPTSITIMQPIIKNSIIAHISCRPLRIHIPRNTQNQNMTFGIVGITNHAKEHCIDATCPTSHLTKTPQKASSYAPCRSKTTKAQLNKHTDISNTCNLPKFHMDSLSSTFDRRKKLPLLHWGKPYTKLRSG